jgi:hypothetical protein
MPSRRRRFKRLVIDIFLFFTRDCERETVELVHNSVYCLAKRIGSERATKVMLEGSLGKDSEDE